MSNSIKGLLSLLSAGLLFGSFGVWVRLLSSDLSSYQQIAFRNIIALVVSLGIISYKRIEVSFSGISKSQLLLFGITFPTAVVFFTLSVLNTTIMRSIFSFYLGSIIFSLLFGIIVFKEKITIRKTLSLLLVLSGFYVLIQPEGLGLLNQGMIYGILGGLFDTIANVFRKHLSGKLNRIVLTLVPQIGGLLVATGLMLYFGGLGMPEISLSSWVVGIIFGSMIFAINYLTIYGFQHFDLNLGTITISSEVVFASLFGWLIFTEIPRSFDIYGASLIILAIIVGNWPSRKGNT